MNTAKIKLIFAGVKGAMVKHSPEILTGMGVVGMITAGILAVRATPKALILIEEKKKEADVERLSAVETVKTAGKCYIPAVSIAAVSVACIVGASAINQGRNAALATAYALSESSLKDYQEKVIETVGEEKNREIEEAVVSDKIAHNPVSSDEIIFTGCGDTLCYDCFSGRYFKSDVEKIKRVANELNRQMRSERYISLNEFYEGIKLKPIPLGENIGWYIDRGYIDLCFSAQLTENEKPCVVVNYHTVPRYGSDGKLYLL